MQLSGEGLGGVEGPLGGQGLPIGAKLGPRGMPELLRQAASYRPGLGCSTLQQGLPLGPWGGGLGGCGGGVGSGCLCRAG